MDCNWEGTEMVESPPPLGVFEYGEMAEVKPHKPGAGSHLNLKCTLPQNFEITAIEKLQLNLKQLKLINLIILAV